MFESDKQHAFETYVQLHGHAKPILLPLKLGASETGGIALAGLSVPVTSTKLVELTWISDSRLPLPKYGNLHVLVK